MARLEKIKEQVAKLYLSKNPGGDEWADWLYPNHVLVAAKYARQLAERYNIDSDLSEAAALLHDIGDALTSRFSPEHELRTTQTAKKLLEDTGFSAKDQEIIINDALKFHSCHDGQKPKTGVGKVLATADALAHLDTDYYSWTVAKTEKRDGSEKARNWVLPKLERDFNDKICFDEVRKEIMPKYQKLKEQFSK